MAMFKKACLVASLALAGLTSAHAYETRSTFEVPADGIPATPTTTAQMASIFEGVVKDAGVADTFGTENFESQTAGAGAPLSLTLGSAGTATLTGGNGKVSTNAQSLAQGRYSTPGGTQFWEVTTGSEIEGFTISFDREISVFSFWGTDVGDFDGKLTLKLFNGEDQVGSIDVTTGQGGDTNGSLLFFGLYAGTGDQLFDSIRFVTSGTGVDGFGFDTFTIGSKSTGGGGGGGGDVPEPASAALAAIALAGMAATRRRRRA